MKKYFVFRIDTYYPEGGMNDFEKSFATEQEALNYIAVNESAMDVVNDFVHVTWKIIDVSEFL